MDDVGRVQVLKCSQHLVDEILNVLDLKLLLGADDTVEIGFHQFTY